MHVILDAFWKFQPSEQKGKTPCSTSAISLHIACKILTFSQYILVLLTIAATFANIDISQ